MNGTALLKWTERYAKHTVNILMRSKSLHQITLCCVIEHENWLRRDMRDSETQLDALQLHYHITAIPHVSPIRTLGSRNARKAFIRFVFQTVSEHSNASCLDVYFLYFLLLFLGIVVFGFSFLCRLRTCSCEEEREKKRERADWHHEQYDIFVLLLWRDIPYSMHGFVDIGARNHRGYILF